MFVITTLSNARKTFHILRGLGVKKECLTIQEITKLIKILVISKLVYAAEILDPSKAVIAKVDRFLIYMAAKTMGIRDWDPNNKALLWEIGIPDFNTTLEKAKLKYHHKMITYKNNTNGYSTINHSKIVWCKW